MYVNILMYNKSVYILGKQEHTMMSETSSEVRVHCLNRDHTPQGVKSMLDKGQNMPG
jgi:hypothetical protein